MFVGSSFNKLMFMPYFNESTISFKLQTWLEKIL